MVKKQSPIYIKYMILGGIDISDQRMGSLTCKQKTQNWTNVALVYIFYMAKFSQNSFAMNTGQDKVNSFDFGWY